MVFLPPFFSRGEAVSQVKNGFADAIGVGCALIANPNLEERWRINLKENEIYLMTFYLGDARGYSDYPAALIPQVKKNLACRRPLRRN